MNGNSVASHDNRKLVDLTYLSDSSSFYNQSVSSSNETSGTSTVQPKDIQVRQKLYVNQSMAYHAINDIQHSSNVLYENFNNNINDMTTSSISKSQHTIEPFVAKSFVPHEMPTNPNPNLPLNIIHQPASAPIQKPKPSVDKSKFAIKKANDVNFDEYLNKVMKNVLDDLNKPKVGNSIQKSNQFHRSHETLARPNRSIPSQAQTNGQRTTYF